MEQKTRDGILLSARSRIRYSSGEAAACPSMASLQAAGQFELHSNAASSVMMFVSSSTNQPHGSARPGPAPGSPTTPIGFRTRSRAEELSFHETNWLPDGPLAFAPFRPGHRFRRLPLTSGLLGSPARANLTCSTRALSTCDSFLDHGPFLSVLLLPVFLSFVVL